PFSFRLTTTALEGAPEAATRALVGGQVAVLGVVGLLAATALKGRRLPLAGGALVLLGAGAALAFPPLAIDAYPTTYLRPSVPYQATSIAEGASLYRANCAVRHGTPSPTARGSSRPTSHSPWARRRRARSRTTAHAGSCCSCSTRYPARGRGWPSSRSATTPSSRSGRRRSPCRPTPRPPRSGGAAPARGS